MLPRPQIIGELTALRFEDITVNDTVYRSFNRRWVEDELIPYHLRRPWIPRPESNDCDDAALSCREDIRRAVQKNPAWNGYGFPAGEIDLLLSSFNTLNIDQWTGHSAVIMRLDDGNWIFYDRQTPKDIRLFKSLLDDGSILRCLRVRL